MIIGKAIKNIVYLGGLISFFSCGITDFKVKNLSYEEINIPISSPYMEQYEGDGNIWCKNDTFFFGSYNHHTHAIDIIDLSHRKTLRSIPLEEQGPNAVNYIRNLYIQDTLIICRNAMSFLTLNKEGKIISRWDINRIQDSTTNRYYLLNRGGVILGNYKHFFYHPQNNTIFYQIYPESFPNNTCSALAEFNLQRQQYRLLPVFYPPHFDKNILYSDLSSVYIAKKGDSLIYNYPYSCRLYCCDILSKKTKEYNPQSSFTPNDFSLKKLPLSPKEKMRYELNCLRFGPIHTFDKLNIYARIHYAPLKDNETIRQKYLMLLDEQFRLIAEYPLSGHFRDKYYVSGNYIFFYLSDISEGFFKIAKIDVQKLIQD